MNANERELKTTRLFRTPESTGIGVYLRLEIVCITLKM